MRTHSSLIKIVAAVALLRLPLMGIGCGSFEPASYFSRNACDFLNCEMLFFLEDMFPLSAMPAGAASMAGAGSGAAMAEPEEDEGHMH